MRTHLPHPAAQLGGTRPPGAGSSALGGVTAAPHGPTGFLPGPGTRPAGLGAKPGLGGGFRSTLGGVRPVGQPVPGPSSIRDQQPPAPAPPGSAPLGVPRMPPTRPPSTPLQPPAPGHLQGLQQQQPPPQQGPAPLGPPRFGQAASAGATPAALPTLANGGVPLQGRSAALSPFSSSSAASAQRQPLPPFFGAASPALQRGPVPPGGPPSTGAVYHLCI